MKAAVQVRIAAICGVALVCAGGLLVVSWRVGVCLGSDPRWIDELRMPAGLLGLLLGFLTAFAAFRLARRREVGTLPASRAMSTGVLALACLAYLIGTAQYVLAALSESAGEAYANMGRRGDYVCNPAAYLSPYKVAYVVLGVGSLVGFAAVGWMVGVLPRLAAARRLPAGP